MCSLLGSRVQAYVDLTKPKIVFLLDFTALMAFLVATRSINVFSLAVVLVAGTLASGGAGALNCYLDRDIDQNMGRTSQRPIPKGEVSPFNALVFGLALVAGGVGISLLLLSLWASLFIFLGAAIYVGFYTKWLKRRTTLNIVLGGSAGSCAPLAGWAAATGNVGAIAPWLMALLVFVWTPSHFWSLALRASKDMRKLGFQCFRSLLGARRPRSTLPSTPFSSCHPLLSL